MPRPPARQNWKEEDPDEVLLAASLRDPEAFAPLVQRYERKLHGLLWRLCGPNDDLEDLYQQVWIRVWGARASFEGRSRFGTWLYAIALNQVREWRRRYRPQVDIQSLPEAASPAPGALDRLLGRARHAEVEAALRTLSDGDRNVLTLRYMQELDYTEIARLQKSSVAQLRLRCFRALRRLRERLQAKDS